MAYEKKTPTTVTRETNSKAKETVKNGIQEPNKLDEDQTVPEPESVFELPEDTEPKEVKSAIANKVRARINELEEEGKSVVYPTNESNWDQALLDRLNKA